MGNRSKYAVAATVAGAGAVAARRARLRRAMAGIHDVVERSSFEAGLAEPAPVADDGHAPGHQHLGPPQGGTRGVTDRERFQVRRRHGWPFPFARS